MTDPLGISGSEGHMVSTYKPLYLVGIAVRKYISRSSINVYNRDLLNFRFNWLQLANSWSFFIIIFTFQEYFTEHFLLLCPLFDIQRGDLFAGISVELRTFVQISILSKNDEV